MVTIELIPVESSNIKAIGYDVDSKTLRVEFAPRKDGTVARYDYAEVPVELFEGMKAAPSVGSFFARNVKQLYDVKAKEEVKPEAAQAAGAEPAVTPQLTREGLKEALDLNDRNGLQ